METPPLAVNISVASLIAAATPSTRDDEIVGKIKKWVNVLALNVGGASPK